MANNYLQLSSMFHIQNPELAQERLAKFLETLEALQDLPSSEQVSKAHELEKQFAGVEVHASSPEAYAQKLWVDEVQSGNYNLEIIPSYEFVKPTPSMTNPPNPQQPWSFWVGEDDYADLSNVAFLCQVVLSTQPEGTEWTIPYAYTCSKLRVDEFGGGVLVVSAHRYQIWEVDSLVDRTKANWYGLDILNDGVDSFVACRHVCAPVDYDGLKIRVKQIEDENAELKGIFLLNDDARALTVTYNGVCDIQVFGSALAKIYPFVKQSGDWSLLALEVHSTKSINPPTAGMFVVRSAGWVLSDIDSAYGLLSSLETRLNQPIFKMHPAEDFAK